MVKQTHINTPVMTAAHSSCARALLSSRYRKWFLPVLLLLVFLLAACVQPLDGEPVPSLDAPQPAVKTSLSSLLAGPTANTSPTITTVPQAITSNSIPAPGPTATLVNEAGGDQDTTREVVDPIDEMSLPYYAQPGDTLPVVAARFRVRMDEITSPDPLPASGLLRPGQLLVLPSDTEFTLPVQPLIPDSEVVYSPSAVDFDASAYLQVAGGYLSQNPEYLRSTGWTDPGLIVERVALENSINPRMLISLLEYSCGCVLADGGDQLEDGVFLGVEDFRWNGLYGQLAWAAYQLSVGYYGWRDGSLLEFPLPDGIIYRPAPDSNAGSVALVYYFSQLWAARELAAAQVPGSVTDFDRVSWELALDVDQGLPTMHEAMFGDSWARAQAVEPLLPAGLKQPELVLPFEPGYVWVFASGPHAVWQREGALAALDFAPATHATGCVETNAWVVAVADGPIVRSAHGAVVQDVDHDGERPILSDMHEQTGWAIFYMHIAEEGRVAVGTYLRAGDPLGHPSCEGGPATGTHLHIARKYNGEWIPGGEPLPFVMDGWTVLGGAQPYEGTLVRGDQMIVADPWGTRKSQMTRQVEE